MKYLQTRILKNLPSILLVFFLCPAHAQPMASRLAQADSLFQLKQYTQSFGVYDALLSVGYYSPAMLLKMAFIQEGLGKISYSLYYLNLYYLYSGDNQALSKMQELAEKNKLQGYQYPQQDQFYYHAGQYNLTISFFLATAALLFLAWIFRQRKKGLRATGALVVHLILLLLLAFNLNYPLSKPAVIVSGNNTYLMSGPSAGASVVAIIGEGHKLRVNSKKDVWLEVEWMDRPAYLRENRALPVSLKM
jgi:hypothetical protein